MIGQFQFFVYLFQKFKFCFGSIISRLKVKLPRNQEIYNSHLYYFKHVVIVFRDNKVFSVLFSFATKCSCYTCFLGPLHSFRLALNLHAILLKPSDRNYLIEKIITMFPYILTRQAWFLFADFWPMCWEKWRRLWSRKSLASNSLLLWACYGVLVICVLCLW